MKSLIIRIKHLFIISLAFFMTGSAIGAYNGGLAMQELLQPSEVLSGDVIRNNLIIGGVIIIAGWVSAGLFSSLIMIYNGYLVGFTVSHVTVSYGIEPLISGLLPHFFIELLGLLLCATLGLFTAQALWCWLKKKPVNLSLFIRDGIVLLACSLALIVFAGYIEGTFSKVIL